MRHWSINAIVVSIGAVAVFSIAAIVSANGIDRVKNAHPPTGRFVQVDGGKFHVVELGRSSAPAVVLLHGTGTNLADMRYSLADRLAAQYHVILIDRPGHGWSDRPDGVGDASPRRQAALIHAAIEQIGVRRATLVGHSWSAALALAYALDYPQDIAGLVLLAPLAYPRQQTIAWPKNVIDVLLAQTARLADASYVGPFFARTVLYPMGEVLLRLAVRNAFAPQVPPPDYIAKTTAELLLRPSDFIANGQDIALIDGFLRIQAPDYARVLAPTAIIAGDSDAVFSADAQAKRLAKVLPRATLSVLPGVGHMVHYAAPGRVIEAVGKFANRAIAQSARQ